MDNVVKTTVLLSNIADFVPMNEVYAEFLKETALHVQHSRGSSYSKRCIS